MRTNRTWRRMARGFSLLELMLVLAIIGALMAVVAINVLGASDKANIKTTRASMSTLKSALIQYKLEHTSVPPGLQALVTARIVMPDTRLKDAWETDFLYEARAMGPDQPFILRSAGPDKQAGTEDDIDCWQMNR